MRLPLNMGRRSRNYWTSRWNCSVTSAVPVGFVALRSSSILLVNNLVGGATLATKLSSPNRDCISFLVALTLPLQDSMHDMISSNLSCGMAMYISFVSKKMPSHTMTWEGGQIFAAACTTPKLSMMPCKAPSASVALGLFPSTPPKSSM